MTNKAIKFECKKDCKKKNTSECYELNCIEGQTDVLEQLSRKTVECDKKSWVIGDLCYKIHNQRKEINNRLKQIEAFKQENEELKAENQNLKSSLTNSIMSKFISLCNETSKHKQALDVIEKELKEDIYCESQECGSDDYEECLKCTKEHILDIIRNTKEKNNGL